MLDEDRKYQRAKSHSRRVAIYRILLVIIALFGLICFGYLTVKPYMEQAKKLPPNQIEVKQASVMEAPKLDGYKNGKKLYEITAVKTREDSSSPGLLILEQVQAKFFCKHGDELTLNSQYSGRYNEKAKMLEFKEPVTGKFLTDREFNFTLANGLVDVNRQSLAAKGEVTVTGSKLRIKGEDLVATDSGDDIKLLHNVVLDYKDAHLMADRAEIYKQKMQAIFSGNVVVTQGEDYVKAPEMIVNSYKDGDKLKLKTIDALGGVVIKQKGNIATAAEATMDYRTGDLSLRRAGARAQPTVLLEDGKDI